MTKVTTKILLSYRRVLRKQISFTPPNVTKRRKEETWTKIDKETKLRKFYSWEFQVEHKKIKKCINTTWLCASIVIPKQKQLNRTLVSEYQNTCLLAIRISESLIRIAYETLLRLHKNELIRSWFETFPWNPKHFLRLSSSSLRSNDHMKAFDECVDA